MRPPARVLAAAAACLLAAGLAGCTAPPPLPRPAAPLTASPTPSPTPGLDVAEVAAAARRAVGSGTVVSVGDESDGTSWEVHVVDAAGASQEVHLGPDGAVTAGPSVDDTTADVRSHNRALVAASSVSLPAATARMTGAVPGGRVTAIGLQEYRDRVTWVGDVTDRRGVRHDVRIDGVSGSVSLDRADRQPTPGGS